MLMKTRAVIEALASDKHFGLALYDLYDKEKDNLLGMSDFKLREFARDCGPIDELLRYKQGPLGSTSALYRNQETTDKTKEDYDDELEQPAPFTPRVANPRRASAGTKSYKESPKWTPRFLTEQDPQLSDDYEGLVSPSKRADHHAINLHFDAEFYSSSK